MVILVSISAICSTDETVLALYVATLYCKGFRYFLSSFEVKFSSIPEYVGLIDVSVRDSGYFLLTCEKFSLKTDIFLNLRGIWSKLATLVRMVASILNNRRHCCKGFWCPFSLET